MARSVKINAWAILAVLIVGGIAVDQLVTQTHYTDFLFAWIPGQTGTGEYSRFTGTAVKRDAIATDIGTEIAVAWYDWNGDGAFSFDETEQMTTASGVFTSTLEYPIGVTIYIQIDVADFGETYQTEVFEIMMSGSRNSDGGAKQIGNLEVMATDDAITFYGLIGGIAWDDGTDYNMTLNGAEERADCYAQLATADAGYHNAADDNFLASDPNSFYSWLTEKEYMGTFLGTYMTNADAVELGVIASEFDYYHIGATNTFMAMFIHNDVFYDSDATSAPSEMYSFSVDGTATGTLVYIGLFQYVTVDDFYKDTWGPATDATIVGTPGADWDWTVN